MTFGDGAVATGSFVFDADTLDYFDIDIETTDGPVVPGTTYTHEHPTFPPDPTRILVTDDLPLAIGVHAMNIRFSSALTNAGGVVSVDTFALGIEGLCTSAGCFGVDPFRRITAGEVRGTAVPEPSVFALLAAGLASALWKRGSSPSRPSRGSSTGW